MPLGGRDLDAFYGRRVSFPVIAHAGIIRQKGNKPPIVVAVAGLAWRFYNSEEDAMLGRRRRCDIFLAVLKPKLVNPLLLVRWGKRMLRTAQQVGETSVFCIRDDEPNSEKLLTLVGLERQAGDVTITFDDGASRTGEVWRWNAG